MWRLHIRVFHLCGNFNFGCSNLRVCLVLRGYREGTGMGGVRKFWRIFRKGKGWGGRELGTENPIHNTNLTIYPISFLTSFSHEISLKLESSTFSLPPFTTCDVIFYMYIFLLYWMKMESSFSFPPFWHLWCYILIESISLTNKICFYTISLNKWRKNESQS